MFRSIIVNISRVLLSLTFIFSGFVKAVDPIGTQYKIHDYLEAVGLNEMVPDMVTLGTSVMLSMMEFSLGVFLLFAMMRKLVSRVVLLFMLVMTLVTLWLWIENPVSDCGCFGDAIHLTNGETLVKNLILLVMAAVVAWMPLRMPRFVTLNNQWIVFHYTFIFILGISVWSLYYLPLFDFRPYKVGTNIPEGMVIPEGEKGPEFETTFIMEKDGERKEFSLDDYPDSTWTFIDSKTKQVAEGFVPPIHDFDIQLIPSPQDGDADEEDITEEVLTDDGYTFLLISPHLEYADDSNFGDIDMIYEYANDNGYNFYCLTASGDSAIQRWREMTGAEYRFCHTDETTLKTIIRSNPGLLLLKEGTIINKWSHNALPSEEMMEAPLEKSEFGQIPRDATAQQIILLLLWYAMPLALLVIADRLWLWSKWIKRKQKIKLGINPVLDNMLAEDIKNKSKTMRKKIVAGNWKMNKNLQEGVALAKELTEVVKNPNCEVIIGTPFIHLASVADVIKDSCIKLSAENCANKASGAYTGEVSAEMVKSTGAEYVILGHSERREYYNETPEILKEKVELALANGLKVIFCIGESLAQREANEQEAVCKEELAGSVFHLSAEQWKNIVIAYEPIWAIGTGKTATAEQAEEIHAYIRSCVAEVYGAEVADDTTILYGGSCKASNAPELFAKADIDGGLIGGASLKAADFKGIIDAWN